jgi:microcystin-dependent protein
MTVESASFVSGLVPAYPPGSDSISEGDDHLRLIKSVLQGTFPNANAAVNGIHTGDSAPTSTTAGQLWFDTTLNVLKIRNEADAAWVTLGASPVTDFKILGSNTVGWIPPTADGSPNQFLTTDGSGNLDWASASGDELPSQTGHSGKYLTTDGSSASWASTGVIPSGGIIMWSGAISAIPSGWLLCNGVTVDGVTPPNLTGKFVIHADADSGGSYPPGGTGAAAATGDHTLTTAQMPTHVHDYKSRGFTETPNAAGSQDYSDETTNYPGGTGSAGDSDPHSHTQTLPPYYALAYIYKI